MIRCFTRQHGYPGALVSAYVLAGYMSEPLVRYFGQAWFTSGELALTFVGRGVQQGDVATCHGEIVSEAETPAGRVITLDVWMDKADGSRVVVGQARALLQ